MFRFDGGSADPASTTNDETGKPFDLKLIRKVFSEDCYDIDPENPWRYQHKNTKVFLTDDARLHRFEMCQWLLASQPTTGAWFYNNVVWIDPCSSIIPGSYKQFLKMRQLLKGGKGWQSDDAKQQNENLRGPKFANTQTTFEGTKMNWVIILARGVVGVDILPQTWELGAAGMAVVVERLKGRLRDMLGARAVLPTVLMSDRGTGMYAPSGHVTRAYDCAARRCGFKLFWGADAKQQAPDMPDLLLHETAVSWLRGVLRKTKPVVPPWRESPAQWSRRMMDAVAVVNDGTKDVDGLCMQFVDRLEECLAKRGARLSY